jgi:hypothetical protein
MEYGYIHAHAVDIDTSAGELNLFCPGGLPAFAGTWHEGSLSRIPSFQRRSTGQKPGSYRCNDRTDALPLSAFPESHQDENAAAC